MGRPYKFLQLGPTAGPSILLAFEQNQRKDKKFPSPKVQGPLLYLACMLCLIMALSTLESKGIMEAKKLLSYNVSHLKCLLFL